MLQPVFLFVVLLLQANGTTYYFSSSLGSDSRTAAEAQNPNTPFASTSSLSKITPLPGDSFLFKRGDVFQGYIDVPASGTANNSILYGSYGEGPKPIITLRNQL